MKRSMYLWLLCLPFWGLTACSGDDGDETPPPGEEPPATEELVGSGAGSGMAVMFLCTGTLGFLASLITGRSRWIKELEEPDGRAE